MSSANPATSNTDGVKQQDRQATGPQPDQTPVGPGGVPSGGGSTPTGPAGGPVLSGTFPNPSSNPAGQVQWSIVQATRFTYPAVTGYPGVGTANLNMTGQNNIFLTLSGGLTIVDAGRTSGMINFITIINPTGSPIAVVWPVWTITRDALPTSVPANTAYDVIVRHVGPNVSDGFAHYNSPPSTSGGTVTSVTTAGRGATSTPNPIVGSGTITNFDPDHFNVADYGAVPNVIANWAPNINACIAAAVTYATINNKGCATVYFPKGLWYISSEILATFTQQMNLALKGDSEHGSIIVVQTSMQNAIHLDLSNGGADTFIKNRVTCSNLGFWVDDSSGAVQVGTAVLCDYGAAAFDQHYNGGSRFENLFFYNNNSNNGGWTYGLHLRNVWAPFVNNIWGYGNSSGYTTASVPGAGDGGAGSGAFIVIEGAVNHQMSNLYYEYWSEGVQIVPLGGIGGVGLVPQGVTIKGINCVETFGMIHAYKNAGGAGFDSLRVSDWLCDNGNNPNNGHRSITLEGGNAAFISQGDSRLDGNNDHITHVDTHDCFYTAVNFETIGTGKSFQFSGASTNNLANGCIYNSTPINCDAGSNNNQFNNVGGLTITGAGTGNTSKPGLF